MKREFRFRLSAAARSIAVCSLAFTLAACNSSSHHDKDAPPITETPEPEPEPTPESLKLSLLGRFETGKFGVSAAEIPSYDAGT